MVANHLRPCLDLIRASLLVALVAMALCAAACTSKHCTGEPITCVVNANQCGSVPGCRNAPGCQYKFGGIDGMCHKQTNEQACQAVTSSDCAWSDNQCESACFTITDPASCVAFDPSKTFPCSWSDCSGVPDKPFCADYPVDQCPAELGCQVTESDPVGT